MTVQILHNTDSSLFKTVIAHVKQWYRMDDLKARIRHERDQLAELTDRELRDIGLTREQALREVNRSYHDVPDHRC